MRTKTTRRNTGSGPAYLLGARSICIERSCGVRMGSLRLLLSAIVGLVASAEAIKLENWAAGLHIQKERLYGASSGDGPVRSDPEGILDILSRQHARKMEPRRSQSSATKRGAKKGVPTVAHTNNRTSITGCGPDKRKSQKIHVTRRIMEARLSPSRGQNENL